MRSSDNQKVATGPPQANSWPDYGRVDQEAVGEPPTQFETPGRMLAQAEADGERLGAARVSEEAAVGEGSGAMQSITGASKARKAVVGARSLGERLQPAKRVAAKGARLKVNAARGTAAARKLGRFEKGRLRENEKDVRDQTQVVNDLRNRYDTLPRFRKGYLSLPVMVAVELGVVAFDGGSLHTALTRAGFSPDTVLYLSATVPILILAVNHGLGVASGSIADVFGRGRLKLAVGAFTAGFVMLVTALVMLMVFRGQATSNENAVLADWAAGNFHASSSLLISPLWLGPAQIAGSIAAIIAVAFFTVAGDGRELRSNIHKAREHLAHLERGCAGTKADIENAYREHDAVLAIAAEIEAEAAEAQAVLDAHPEIHAARLEAEDGLAESARGRVRTAYTYVSQIFANGKVIRVALATVSRWWRRSTPPPGDAEGEPYRPPAPDSRNGNGQMDFDDLRHFIKH
jgi:hypothetical protein